MNFRAWLAESIQEELEKIRLTPDDLWNGGDQYQPRNGILFIYTLDDNQFYVGNFDLTHRYYIHESPKLSRFHSMVKDMNLSRFDLMRHMVLGRAAQIKLSSQPVFVISVWNDSLPNVCLEALKPYIRPYLSSMPILICTAKGNRVISNDTTTQTTYDPEQWRLLQRLHLLTGIEKTNARKALGLWSVKERPDTEFKNLQPEQKQ